MQKLILKLLAEHGQLSCLQTARMLGTSTQLVNDYVKTMDLDVIGKEKDAKGNLRRIYGIKK